MIRWNPLGLETRGNGEVYVLVHVTYGSLLSHPTTNELFKLVNAIVMVGGNGVSALHCTNPPHSLQNSGIQPTPSWRPVSRSFSPADFRIVNPFFGCAVHARYTGTGLLSDPSAVKETLTAIDRPRRYHQVVSYNRRHTVRTVR